ncbi:hypothetical protein AAUPMB_03223 [Pasteurella multocida subsp. multocida str. Anand1_buffalo]|nr:hypothetical protein AAUPMB_03223 [Pasteurella multocida subsp. multocida str. Anand1_buffalo]
MLILILLVKSDKGYFVGRYNAKNIGTDSRVSLVERPISLSCKGFPHIGLDIAGFGNAAIVQAQTVGKSLDNPQEAAQAKPRPFLHAICLPR